MKDITGPHSCAAKRSLIRQCTDEWILQGGKIYNDLSQPMDAFEAFNFVKKSLQNNRKYSRFRSKQLKMKDEPTSITPTASKSSNSKDSKETIIEAAASLVELSSLRPKHNDEIEIANNMPWCTCSPGLLWFYRRVGWLTPIDSGESGNDFHRQIRR